MLKSKAGRLTDSWNGINYYGYKNSICIDVDNSFIRLYAVTPANVHESQMLPHILDPENKRTYVWADSAYSGEYLESLLSLGGLESLIHEKGARNHPLSDADKKPMNLTFNFLRYLLRTLMLPLLHMIYGEKSTHLPVYTRFHIGSLILPPLWAAFSYL